VPRIWPLRDYTFIYGFCSSHILAALTHQLPWQVKGKGIPLQALEGSWGSRRLRLLDPLDTRRYEGGKVVTFTHRPPSPPGVFLVLIFRGWVDPRAHGSVTASENIPSETTGNRFRDHYATPVVTSRIDISDFGNLNLHYYFPWFSKYFKIAYCKYFLTQRFDLQNGGAQFLIFGTPRTFSTFW
jgi:hypothetical protein